MSYNNNNYRGNNNANYNKSNYHELQEKRKNLPVYKQRNYIIEKILKNDLVLVVGETGSGNEII